MDLQALLLHYRAMHTHQLVKLNETITRFHALDALHLPRVWVTDGWDPIRWVTIHTTEIAIRIEVRYDAHFI